MRSEIHDQRGEGRSEKLERDDSTTYARIQSRAVVIITATAGRTVHAARRFAALRSMKMGIIAGPWRCEQTRSSAPQQPESRRAATRFNAAILEMDVSKC
jgi:hypothetical protein